MARLHRSAAVKWSAMGLIALVFGLGTPCIAQQQYTIVDLGDLGAQNVATGGLNNQGQVSGSANVEIRGCGPLKHAFRTSANRPINAATDDLKTLGSLCSNSYALRINDAGVVTGYWVEFKGGTKFAFVHMNGQMRNLPSLMASGGQTEAYGINNRGQIVGSSYKNTVPASWTAVLWDNGKIIDLGGQDSRANGINNKMQIVGQSQVVTGKMQTIGKTQVVGAGGPFRPFIWDLRTKAMRFLDNPFHVNGDRGDHASAEAINDNGLVVGWGQELVPPYYHSDQAFIYDSNTGKFSKIGPRRTLSKAYGVNNRGDVVGALSDTTHDFGFLYSRGKLYRIEGDLVPAGSGWTNLVGNAINDAGQIAGSGTHNGRQHAFLLTPKK